MDFKKFCGDEEFFNPSAVFNSTNPKFSHCFEKLVFDLGPCAYLWIFSIPYFLSVRSSYQSHIPVSSLFKSKIVFTCLLWILTWVDLGRGIWEWYNGTSVLYVDLVTPLIVGVTMAIAAFFIYYDRLKGVRTSGLLTIYWILFLLTWALVFRTKVEQIQNGGLTTGDVMRIVTFFISYACVIAHFLMSFFVDLPPAYEPQDPFAEPLDEEEIIADMKKKLNTSPQESASFISHMFFEWFSKMIMLGYKNPLVDNDLWDLIPDDKSGRISRRFNKTWSAEKAKYKNENEEVDDDTARFENTDVDVLIEQPGGGAGRKKGKPSLFKAMVRVFGPYYFLGSLLKVVSDLLTFVSPQLLSALILFTSNNAPVWQGYMLAVLLFVTAILQSIVLQQYFHVCFTVGMRMRSAVVGAVYRKAMVLSNSARKESTVGEVVNLMSVDAQRFMDLMTYLNTVWSGPFQIILAMYFLWQYLGAAVLAGLGVMLLLIPINALIARKTHQLQVRQMKLKDERIKLMNEILNGIKVLKMYAWEMSFKDKVKAIRDKELDVLRTAAYLNAVGSFTWVSAPFLVSLTTFAVYVLSDSSHILTAQKAFVSLSLFNILRFPLVMLPAVIAAIVQASVSMTRLSKFLAGDELDPDAVDHSPTAHGEVVEVDNATFTWGKKDEPILKNINLSVPSGSLVAVVGQVGTGKSSLISALLGDMDKVEGYVSVKGSIAYVAQQAWIQNLTVQDNILFGKPFDPCLYHQTVDACELKEDFDMLPAGDQTEIGERGINLSGGQKQRVSIARAVYQDADVYLFDDPLSAVDAHVGKNIFDNVLGPRGCLKNKTRLLVTHGVSFLPQVDRIVVLVGGRVSEIGHYDELLEKNGAFAEFLRNYANHEDSESTDEEDVPPSSPPPIFEEELEPDVDADETASSDVIARRKFQRQSSRTIQFKRQRTRTSSSDHCKSGKLRRRKTDRDIDIKAQQKKKDDKLITTETAETGNIKLSVALSYMRSVGYLICSTIALAYCLQNAAQVGSSIWLSQWSTDPLNPDGTQNGTATRLGVYGALGMTQALMVLGSSFSMSYGSVVASTLLHSKMLVRIFRAPMSFFDTTPLGRIVNRFSKDIYLIDEVIPRCFTGLLMTGFQCLSTFVVIVYSTPIFAVVVVPLLILYYFVQRFYIRTSRQLKRLESISRSPIYSHFSETIAGVSTIRAYGLQKSFMKQNEIKLDTNQMAYYPNIVSNRWLALRLELVGNLIVLFAAIFAVVEKGKINDGIVGLSISYSLQITMMLNWLVRQASELETNIVAVERVEEYSSVVQEAELVIDGSRPPSHWPAEGSIKFEDYSTRYREGLDLVVKNITIHINGGEKVGIVGRTGAGKSSMTLALFRIIESASGRITIDGLPISNMGLQDLRSKLSIIPQDPVLFSGSLRMNLDPFEEYRDNELWDALEHSHLKDYVTSLSEKLEHEVTEGGENLSVGQRQLVCLARALLRKSKILVLDEATAAVDLETDDLIQATIREQFSDCTTFTIAHRLNTIMDSTRVLVLDAGKVAEFDTPDNLLQAKGIFFSMAKDAGLAS